MRYPNVYGVDMPNRKEFVAHGLTEDQVRRGMFAHRLAESCSSSGLGLCSELQAGPEPMATCYVCQQVLCWLSCCVSNCAAVCCVQICEVLRADGLVYQDVDDLLEVGMALNPNIKTFDAACFDGHYVTGAHSQPRC